jgi:transposase
MDAIIVGLDIAKSVFHVHVADSSGRVLHSKKLRRSQVEPFFARLPRAVVGIEACGGAHHWGRVLAALGHEVRLIPAAYVKPFVKRNKNDARDAEAICEAVQRPNMKFVAIKTVEQQAERGLERSLELLTRQRTQLRNSVRALLAEHGVIAGKGERGFAALVNRLDSAPIPALLGETLRLLVQQIERLSVAISVLENRIVAAVRRNPVMQRLMTIPGVGPITAHAVVTAIGDGRQFGCARDFAAWCGLTPREHATAGKRRSQGISRQGEQRLRKLFALGASTTMRHLRIQPQRATPWQRGILARRPVKVAVLAQAAKTARIAWAMLMSGQTYGPAPLAGPVAE